MLWLGDLNYRLSDLEVDHVKDLIAKKDFEALYNHDQVRLNTAVVCLGSVELDGSINDRGCACVSAETADG